jgi:hypothetical protein
MARIAIFCTIEDGDLARFLASEPDPRTCFAARLDEVYGGDGAVVMTSLKVVGFDIAEDL